MNRANAEFWAKEAARRSKQLKRIDKYPATSIAAIKTLGDLCREIDLSFDFKQRARAGKPRKKRPTAAIDKLLADNPNMPAKEAWRKVENLPEAKGKTESAFASLLSRRKKKLQ